MECILKSDLWGTYAIQDKFFGAARQRWMDWQMRIFQRNILNGVAKSIASGLRIFRAYIPTALPMDYATEAVNIAPFTRHPQIPARTLALDSPDPDSDAEPQFSGEEVSSSGDDTVSGNDTLFQPSSQSSSEQPSIASTLVVSSSDEDTGTRALPAGRGSNGLANEPRILHRRSKLSQSTLPRHLNPQITTP